MGIRLAEPGDSEELARKGQSITLLSFRGYALHRGVSPEAVSQAVKSGRIDTVQDPDGRRWIHPAIADAQWDARSDSAKKIGADVAQANRLRRRAAGAAESVPIAPAPPPMAVDPEPEPAPPPRTAASSAEPVPAPGSYAAARAQREHYQAELKRLEVLRRSGESVSIAEVKREAFARARAVREAIMGLPDRLAAELAGERDPNKVHSRLLSELHSALEGLSDG